MEFVSHQVDNIVGKGQNADFQLHFFSFSNYVFTSVLPPPPSPQFRNTQEYHYDKELITGKYKIAENVM